MLESVERQAEEVLARVQSYVWDGETLPVPVEHIADSCFGLRLCDVADLTSAPGVPKLAPGQSLSGLFLPAQWEIWINAAESQKWPPRRRFTISHELGHCVLHQDTGGHAIFCRKAAIEESDERPALPVQEQEANAFAAALLMPRDLLVLHYRQPGREFRRLCQTFDVSMAAMSRRLHSVIPRRRRRKGS